MPELSDMAVPAFPDSGKCKRPDEQSSGQPPALSAGPVGAQTKWGGGQGGLEHTTPDYNCRQPGGTIMPPCEKENMKHKTKKHPLCRKRPGRNTLKWSQLLSFTV